MESAAVPEAEPRPDKPPSRGDRPRMFRWLSPRGLFFLALDVVVSGLFGRYADKREIEGAMARQAPFTVDGSSVWFDYVADVGDGWDATATIAWLLAQPMLRIETASGGVETQRGAFLVMGGDEVYPTASEDRYDVHLRKPYAAAMAPEPPGTRALFAIPGNHDWYDGLTSFLRTFCQSDGFAGFVTPQQRSYFSVELPSRWWILGIDIAFDYYLDEAQLAYFDSLVCARSNEPPHADCHAIHAGDRVILCTAKPGWEEAGIRGDFRSVNQKTGRRALYEFEQRIARRWGCRLRLVLSGDLHHYARYESAAGGAVRITAGGGGAAFYPTHSAPEVVSWPSGSKDGPIADALRLRKVFPSTRTSRSWWPAIVVSPIVANPSFVAFAGALYLLLSLLIPGSVVDPHTGLRAFYLPPDARPIFVITTILVYLGLVGFADARTTWGRCVIGLTHWLAHVVALTFVVRVCHAGVADLFDRQGWSTGGSSLAFALCVTAAILAVGGLVGGLVFGVYLFAMQLFGRHPNEAYAALHLSRYKNFLRLHLDADGDLTIYPIGIPRVAHRWHADANTSRPLYAPDEPPTFELIEGPIRIAPE